MRKIEKFNALLKQAVSDNQVILVETYLRFENQITMNISDEDFDLRLISFMKELATEATSLLEKNNTKKLGEEKIYCLSLLSYSFLSGKASIVIEGKNVKIKQNGATTNFEV